MTRLDEKKLKTKSKKRQGRRPLAFKKCFINDEKFSFEERKKSIFLDDNGFFQICKKIFPNF